MIATCALGLEEFVEAELRALGFAELERERGAVRFTGGWPECWRTNYWLRTANRVLVELDRWVAQDGDGLYQGAVRFFERNRSYAGLATQDLLHPLRSLSLRSTTSRSQMRDTRWVSLRVKDGLVDAQRSRFGQRSNVEKRSPDNALRVWLYEDHATLLLDTSVEPLDRRGYRVQSTEAPVREQLAAACILASSWDGKGPVVDPMCGSGTLLIEAGWYGGGLAPGHLRDNWAFERLPSYRKQVWDIIRRPPEGLSRSEGLLYGVDNHRDAVTAARLNLERAGLADRGRIRVGDGYEVKPPEGTGLVVMNPSYGERLEENQDQWRRIGDLLKQRFTGWKAVVLAGDESRGKQLGLRPTRRIPVKNGPIDARILTLDLY